MPAAPDFDQNLFYFIIRCEYGNPPANPPPGGWIDQGFIERYPNLIQVSNFTIPYLAQTKNLDSVFVARQIFGFTS